MFSKLADLPFLLSRTIIGITDYGVQVDDNQETCTIDGKNVKCAPGLKLTDQAGIRVSRQAGWILSYNVIKKYLDENIFLDWVPEEAMEPQFAIFSNSLLKLHAKRKKLRINMAAEERIKVTEQGHRTKRNIIKRFKIIYSTS